jgi:hypothetical protein
MTDQTEVLSHSYFNVRDHNEECVMYHESEEVLDRDAMRLDTVRNAKSKASSQWAQNFLSQLEMRMMKSMKWKMLENAVGASCRSPTLY